MGRPKLGVTPKNLLEVITYFENALKDERLWDKSDFITDNFKDEAEQEFKAVLRDESNWENDSAKLQTALQEWADKYVLKQKWERCLKTLRQHKRRKKYTMRCLDLPQDVLITIKAVADKMQLGIVETIRKLAETELNKPDSNCL